MNTAFGEHSADTLAFTHTHTLTARSIRPINEYALLNLAVVVRAMLLFILHWTCFSVIIFLFRYWFELSFFHGLRNAFALTLNRSADWLHTFHRSWVCLCFLRPKEKANAKNRVFAVRLTGSTHNACHNIRYAIIFFFHRPVWRDLFFVVVRLPIERSALTQKVLRLRTKQINNKMFVLTSWRMWAIWYVVAASIASAIENDAKSTNLLHFVQTDTT